MPKKYNVINRYVGVLEKFIPDHLLEADMDIGERVRLRTLLFMITTMLALTVLLVLPLLLVRFPFSEDGRNLFICVLGPYRRWSGSYG